MINQKLKDKAFKYIDKKRQPHVEGCMEQAVHLAKKYGINEDTAEQAALFHDITKNRDYDGQLKLIKKYDLDFDEQMLSIPKILHAVTGAGFAKDKFGVSNEIYDAIRYHTTGKPNMTTLEKIIFLADVTEKTRDFPGVDELRKLCDENLDKAMEKGLEMSMANIANRKNDNNGKDQIIYKDTVNAYEFYKTINS